MFFFLLFFLGGGGGGAQWVFGLFISMLEQYLLPSVPRSLILMLEQYWLPGVFGLLILLTTLCFTCLLSCIVVPNIYCLYIFFSASLLVYP